MIGYTAISLRSVQMNQESTLLQTINLSGAGADFLLARAMEAAKNLEASMTIAVADGAGHLIALRRMDSASLISIDVAIGKAKSAAMLGRPTRAFGDLIDEGKPSMLGVRNVLPVAGGIPIIVRGTVVGAIGVSGSTSERDESVAREAVNDLERTLLAV